MLLILQKAFLKPSNKLHKFPRSFWNHVHKSPQASAKHLHQISHTYPKQVNQISLFGARVVHFIWFHMSRIGFVFLRFYEVSYASIQR